MAFTKNIDKLGKLLSTLDENHLSKADFEEAMKKVLDFLVEVNKRNRGEFSQVSAQLGQDLRDIRDSLSSDVERYKVELSQSASIPVLNEIARRVDSMEEFSRQLMALEDRIRTRLSELKDGRDGVSPDINEIVKRVKAQLPRYAPDTKEEVRNKLESLEGDARLSIDAIKGLSEQLKKIEKTKLGYGGGIIGRDLIKNYDLSASLDGATKTFNIPGTWSIIGVYCSSFPHALRPTIDYVYTAQTITFTSEIDETTTLAAGQTVVLTLVSA